MNDRIAVPTRGKGLYEITGEVQALVDRSGVAACNQKSNRDPVMSLTETEVVEKLDAMRRDVLVWRTDGARSERWSQSISRRLELDPWEKAILTLLLLRGPQTPGELGSRSARLQPFENLEEVEEALARMAADRSCEYPDESRGQPRHLTQRRACRQVSETGRDGIGA